MGMKIKLKEEMLGTKELLDSVAKGIESLGYQTLYGPEYRDAKRKEKPQVLCNTERTYECWGKSKPVPDGKCEEPEIITDDAMKAAEWMMNELKNTRMEGSLLEVW